MTGSSATIALEIEKAAVESGIQPNKRLQFEQIEPLYYPANSARLLLRQQLFVI